jgi:hypothetical protein
MSFFLILGWIKFRPQLHPFAQMAYSLLFAIPKVTRLHLRRGLEYLRYVHLGAQTLLEQFERDDNIQTLLVAMRDAFDFTNQEGTLKTTDRVPRQARSSRSCCSMSAIAATSSNCTHGILNSVRNYYPFRWRTQTWGFQGFEF